MDQNDCSNEDTSGYNSINWVSNDNDDTNVASIFPLTMMETVDVSMIGEEQID